MFSLRTADHLGGRRYAALFAAWFASAAFLPSLSLAEDPPRRVGSLNYISGEVSYALRAEPGDPNASADESWSPADFDQPVCQDMSLKTGPKARARVEIGPDIIQLADSTSLNMLNLSDQLIEASVTAGRIYLQLPNLEPGESVEIETPRGSLWVLQPGAYDLDLGASDQPTRIVVFDGKARFVGGAADLPIAAGKQLQVAGNYPSVSATESDWTGINPVRPATTKPADTTTPGASPMAHSSPTPVTPPTETPPTGPLADKADVAPPHPADSAAVVEETPRTMPQSAAPATATSRDGSSPAASAAGPQIAAAAPVSTDQSAGVSDAAPGPEGNDQFLVWVEASNDQPPQPAPQQSAKYVSDETTGADTLDRYGRWSTLPDSQPVWFPDSVPEDWAPYRFGHWDWIAPWGWTWVDDQPWGFAPFHYGRWVNLDGRWGWVPGAVDPHPVYAPALVAFVDAPDSSGNAPEGGPPVGWFPLGPGDDYAPWYPVGSDYVVAVNAPAHYWHSHEFHPHDYGERGHEFWRAEYANRRFATLVSRDAFVEARRIDRAMVRHIDADRLEHAAVMHGAPHLAPVAMRAPGEFRGEGRGISAAAAAGGLRSRPGPGAARDPGVAEREGPSGGGQRAARAFGGTEAPHGPMATAHANSGQFGRSQIGRSIEPAIPHGVAGHFGQPGAVQGSTQGYQGNLSQFGRPPVPGAVGQFGRPPVPGAVGQFGRPPVPGAVGQFGRPPVPGAVGQFGRPPVPGAVRQFGQPQVAGFRGGLQQFGRPQVFQTPAASARAFGTLGRATQMLRLGGAGGGAVVRHK